jgi:uncharacterized membrane protein YedE/YeeE
MDNKDKRLKTAFILAIIFAIAGMVFSILYLVLEVFIPAASPVSMSLMLGSILYLIQSNREKYSKGMFRTFVIIIIAGILIGTIAGMLQLILYFRI